MNVILTQTEAETNLSNILLPKKVEFIVGPKEDVISVHKNGEIPQTDRPMSVLFEGGPIGHKVYTTKDRKGENTPHQLSICLCEFTEVTIHIVLRRVVNLLLIKNRTIHILLKIRMWEMSEKSFKSSLSEVKIKVVCCC
jgi:hypothetical protein